MVPNDSCTPVKIEHGLSTGPRRGQTLFRFPQCLVPIFCDLSLWFAIKEWVSYARVSYARLDELKHNLNTISLLLQNFKKKTRTINLFKNTAYSLITGNY